MSDRAFLGKSSLITFLGGLGIYGIGLVTGQDEMAVITLLITTVVAFVLALTARSSQVGKVALCLSGAVLLLGTINYVLFLTTGLEEPTWVLDWQSPPNKSIQPDGASGRR